MIPSNTEQETLEFVEWVEWLARQPIGPVKGQRQVWNWVGYEARKVLAKARKNDAQTPAA